MLKVYVGGAPVYKDGEDDDLEVGWEVPRDPGDSLFAYQDTGLPIHAHELDERLGSTLRDYASALAAPRQGERHRAWLRKDSALA